MTADVHTACTWAQDADGIWETDCQNLFVLNDCTPDGNGMKYCCYCGLKLREKPYSDPYEEDEDNQP